MSPANNIPVVLGSPRAGSAADFAGRPPLTAVHIAAAEAWDGITMPTHDGLHYAALIDTGAESTAIDELVARKLGAATLGHAKVHGWKGTASDAEIVRVQIVFPTVNAVFAAAAAVRDFRGDGQPWDVILGRSFLANCLLTVDGPRAAYSLKWIGPGPVPRPSQPRIPG